MNDELMTAMDLLPTFAKLANADIPTDRVIYGKDIWPVLTKNAPSPHKAFFYHKTTKLEAVRSGNWKLHVKEGKPTALYNLETDIGESNNVIDGNDEIVSHLLPYIETFEADLAQNSRPAAWVENAVPLSNQVGSQMGLPKTSSSRD
jgi:arylsulfatase A